MALSVVRCEKYEGCQRDESQQRVQHVLPGCLNKWPVGSRADGLASNITMLHLAQGRLYPQPAACNTQCTVTDTWLNTRDWETSHTGQVGGADIRHQ